MEPWDLENLTIYADFRERPSGLPDVMREYDLFEIEERGLDACDYQVGDVGVERKTGQDLVASIADGRLFRQLILMKRLYKRRLLLIEGDIPYASLPARSQEGLMVRVSIGLQTPILRSTDIRHSARLIYRLALQVFRFAAPHAPPKPAGENTSFYQVLALVSLPGFGLVRARALLERFGSLRAVFNASADELLSVPGIGPRHAETLLAIAGAERAGGPNREGKAE